MRSPQRVMTAVRGSITTAAAAARSDSSSARSRPPTDTAPRTPFLYRNGVGLFFAAVGFLIAGALVWAFYPPVGPGSFPLSSLLLLLGFVAAIGGTLAYFFGREDPFVQAAALPAPPAPSPEPVEPAEFGRPRPEVRRSAKLSTPSSGLGAAVVAAVSPAPPAPAPPPPAEPWEEDTAAPTAGTDGEPPKSPAVGEALAELGRIEREMSNRRPRRPPTA